MHFAFSDDQELFRDTLRDICANECPPSVVREASDTGTGRVPGLWATLADTGVLGLTGPESVGGLGGDELDLVMILEELGRNACPEPVLEHTAVAIPLLAETGAEPGADVLAAAVAGEVTVGVGLRSEQLVVSADTCDWFLLAAGDELHLIEADSASLRPERSVDGSRRLSSVEWSPSEATRLCTDAGLLDRGFDRGALGAAAQCVGVAQRLLDMTVAYVAAREQFGRPVGANQAVKHHLANTAIAIEFARPMTAVAAHGLARSSPDARRDVSMAKSLASDAVDTACRTALQCHGAIGYTVEYDLQLWLKRGWALAGSWGDAAWHRSRVGREIGL